MLSQLFNLRSRNTTIQLEPTPLSESDFSSFVRYELFDPNRDYPIALLTPNADDEYVISPGTFGREFIGLAKTYRAASAASTFVLTDEIGRRELSCFHGAMRIYMPGLEKTSDARHHPLILPRRLATTSERLRIAQILALRTVETFEEAPFVGELRDERAVLADERRTALLSQLQQAKKAARDGDDYRELAEAYAQQNAHLEQEIERLREDLEEAKSKIAALEYALSQRPAGQEHVTLDVPTFAPADVVDAVEQAQELFWEDLLILESAIRSAADSPYRNPSEVAQALASLAKVARRLRDGNLGKTVREVFAEMGLDYGGGLSRTTPKKLRKQYLFADGQREFRCEEHLRIGGGAHDPADCLRIYFTTKDRSHGRIVIGHVGRHLDVISTS